MDGRKTLTCGYGFQRTGWTGCTDLRIRYSSGRCMPDRTVMLADTNHQAERLIVHELVHETRRDRLRRGRRSRPTFASHFPCARYPAVTVMLHSRSLIRIAGGASTQTRSSSGTWPQPPTIFMRPSRRLRARCVRSARRRKALTMRLTASPGRPPCRQWIRSPG